MNEVEMFGEKKYIDEVKSIGGAWVLMYESKLHSLKTDNGHKLLTWISKKEAEEFSMHIKPEGMSAVFVPIENIVNLWLKSASMQIVEVGASTRHGLSTLTFTAEEYIEIFKT